jgi:hypothetical protein
MTENRKKLLREGYTLDHIISGKLNIKSLPVSENRPLNDDLEDTEEEKLFKQLQFFETARLTAIAVSQGISKSLIIAGSAGIGKSHGIESTLDPKTTFYVHGNVSPLGLYKILYEYKQKEYTIIFDDSDSILHNEASLGILKHALDSKPSRLISWSSNTVIKDSLGNIMDNSFIFWANINLDLSGIVRKKTKLSVHIEALISRCLYIDFFALFKTPNDYMVRINYLKDSIYQNENIDATGQYLINNFINANYLCLRELSLRLVVKLGQIYKFTGETGFYGAALILTGK